MSRDKAIAALRASRAADSEAKQQAVRDALAEAAASGAPFTVSAIARQAGVSRQFLYSHSDLKLLVEKAVREPKPQSNRTATSSDVEHGLRATQGALAAKVERQRATINEQRAIIEDLRDQRRRWIGAQLEHQAAIDPIEHAELRAGADRLMDENRSSRRRIAELERLNSIHEADLAAVREALLEALAEHGASSEGSVVGLSAKRGAPPRGRRP